MPKVSTHKRLRWWYHDLRDYFLLTKDGNYVMFEVPNASLIIFMISIVIAVLIYPGWLQRVCWVVAFASILYWSYRELRYGVNRFRKLFGGAMLFMVVITIIFNFIFK